MKYTTCTEYFIDFSKEKAEFRGEFEQMYQDIDDPWTCEARKSRLDNRLFAEIMFFEQPRKRILDIGCGLGGALNMYWERNGGKGEFLGLDISETACCKAEKNYPHMQFQPLNVLTDDMSGLGKFDLIILSELLWCILDDPAGVFAKVDGLLEAGGTVGVNQYFPENQRYGKDIIDGFEGFTKFLEGNTPFTFTKTLKSDFTDGIVLLATLMRKTEIDEGE